MTYVGSLDKKAALSNKRFKIGKGISIICASSALTEKHCVVIDRVAGVDVSVIVAEKNFFSGISSGRRSLNKIFALRPPGKRTHPLADMDLFLK